VGYGGQAILPPIDVTIRQGELWAVVGRNGAGKTTFFRTLLGLLAPVHGRVRIEEKVRLSYIPQRARLDPLIPLRAVDVVAMGVTRDRGWARPRMSNEEKERVQAAIEAMGIGALACKHYGELSEGQKQHVLMARLLASRPQLAVLDEPTAAMDEVAEREALERIDAMRKERGVAFLIVTHHLPVVARYADHVAFLDKDQGVAVLGSATHVFAHPVFRARYGRLDAPTQSTQETAEEKDAT